MAGDDGSWAGASRRKKKRAKLEASIKSKIALEAHTRMAFTVMSYLAFTWSTVVLLGGYVSSLQKKDFRCLTVITIVEATRKKKIGHTNEHVIILFVFPFPTPA
uniref:Uncharacterized protein n=1 Tax=Oryza punctata TaxID=4537 RepID=A0A0E0MDI2_ORYPU